MTNSEQDQVKATSDEAVKASTDNSVTESTSAASDAPAAVKSTSKKRKKTVSHVLLKVSATFTNTIITVTDAQGNTLAWASAGQHFKGSRKHTPFAAETAAQSLVDKLRAYGVRTIAAVLKGAGPGRDAAVKPFGAAGFQVLLVKDATPVPHNGCRPSKIRRT